MSLRLFLISTFLLLTSLSFAQDEVRIPNIITPNGDQVNDVFSIRTSGFETLKCTIFNRYGEPVYRFFGLNGNWDGRTHAGIKVSAGNYFVLVELERGDGTVETRQGNLQVQY
jgi:gliding motility-associated-like protein